MKNQYVIVDWANNKVNTGGETFDTFEDGWSWIYEFINDESKYDDLFVVEVLK